MIEIVQNIQEFSIVKCACCHPKYVKYTRVPLRKECIDKKFIESSFVRWHFILIVTIGNLLPTKQITLH